MFIKIEIVDVHLPGNIAVLTKTIKICGVCVYIKKQTYPC